MYDHIEKDERQYGEAAGAYNGRNYGFSTGRFERGFDRPSSARAPSPVSDGRLGNNAAVIRRYLAREAKALGWDLDDLITALRPGRLDDAGKRRRALLGLLVASARDCGASGSAVGRALGVSKMTVSRLVEPVAGSR